MIDRARTMRAFSVANNVRALFVPDTRHLAPLDGLRAIAILWTMTFHTAWFSFLELPPDRYGELLVDPRLLLAWRGHLGVDVFFVLSGFLIAGLLFDEHERTGRLRLGTFYVRRLMRLWPALLVAIVVTALVTHGDLIAYWPNAIYLSNFVPIMRAHMGATWSLAIEEHFYLVCPWLIDAIARLGTRGRVGVLVLVIAIACGVSAWIALAGGFHPVDTEIALNRPLARWAEGYDALYDKPWMRVPPLLAGVIAAAIQRSASARSAIARSGKAGSALFVVALVVSALIGEWRAFAGSPRVIEVLYIALHRAAFGACIAYVLLLCISEHALGRAIGRVLGARALHPIAQLAYASYLLNPLVTVVVQDELGPALAHFTPAAQYAILLPLDMSLTITGAALLHVLIERPFMALRPRDPDAAPTPVRSRIALDLTMMLALGVALPILLLDAVPRLVPAP